MDNRVIEFVRGLRAAGVRVSLAESREAMQAIQIMGVRDKSLFRETLRATMIKEVSSYRVFDELFPLYFSADDPPLQNVYDDLNLDEQDMLRGALQAMSGRLDDLLNWLTSGEGPTKEELEAMAERMGSNYARDHRDAVFITRQMMREMGFDKLQEKMAELVEKLLEMGMSEEAIMKILGVMEANQEMLVENMARQVGRQIAQDRAERPDDLYDSDLMGKSFDSLSATEKIELRQELGRMVNQLKTRASLRRRRGQQGKFDAKGTIRASQRTGGAPFELKFKKNKQKPSLVLLLDVSGSLRETVDFALRLIYELQDQVSKVRTFAFYRTLNEVTAIMSKVDARNDDEIYRPVRSAVDGGPYQTDLGSCLVTFHEKYLSAVSGRTTVIVVGDGCNSYNDPRDDLLQDLSRRAKKLIWFNTEDPYRVQDDSDMRLYEPHCDAIYPVRNLRQLSAAVDKILID
ncbi:MAG: VWA domain-containing protein [Chloroflexota bacterium]